MLKKVHYMTMCSFVSILNNILLSVITNLAKVVCHSCVSANQSSEREAVTNGAKQGSRTAIFFFAIIHWSVSAGAVGIAPQPFSITQ